MSSLATFRFEPIGREYEPIGREYVMSERLPKIGDVLKRNGDNWTVVEIKEEANGTSTVTLRPGLKPAGS